MIEHPTDGKYILEGKDVVEVHDLLEWGRWMQGNDRRVAKTTFDKGYKGYVSTVFLGLDHSFGGTGPPILFETMIFGGDRDQEQWRYATYDQAEAGHRKIVNELQPRLKLVANGN